MQGRSLHLYGFQSKSVEIKFQFKHMQTQVMKPEDQEKFEFDPLDVTKTWPEDRFPLQPVGRMVLNRNPDNFFAENEQVRQLLCSDYSDCVLVFLRLCQHANCATCSSVFYNLRVCQHANCTTCSSVFYND